MININNFSAYLKQADLRNGQIILYDMETQLATCFQSAGEMFDAGWIADLQSNSQFSLLVETGDVTETQALPAASKELSSQTTATEANRVVSFKTCKARERATMKSKIQS